MVIDGLAEELHALLDESVEVRVLVQASQHTPQQNVFLLELAVA